MSGVALQAQTTHVVTNTNNAGAGSLRDAASNASAGDTIRFSPSLIASGSNTINLISGHIFLGNKGVVIKGLYNNTDTLFISGNNSSRIFRFNGAGKTVLDSLVLINGNVSWPAGGGGAVSHFNSLDTLFITNSRIAGNSSYSEAGGVYYSPNSSNPSPALVVKNSTISGNTATSSGGGIYLRSNGTNTNSSYIIIDNSTISGNSASYGGGVDSEANNSTSHVVVTNSAISGNTVNSGGGAIYSGGSSFSTSPGNSFVTITNSTISNNTAFSPGSNGAADGGGIRNAADDTSLVTITNSTISGNSAIAPWNNSGGGIYSYSSNFSSVVVTQSTISGNTVSSSTSSGNNTYHNRGGGIYCSAIAPSSSTNPASSSVVVTNSTVTENKGSSPWGNYGGGIYSFANSAGSGSINSSITITSSIVAGNLNNTNNTVSNIYNSQSSQGVPTITSNGYNIFSDTPTGAIGSDSTNTATAQLNLEALAFNGGTTQTMRPGNGSIAVNNGNPTDNSNAQNAPIVGIRDIGAAEGCFAIPTTVSITACDTYASPSGNTTYTLSGIYNDTVLTACGADSAITIDLTINYSNQTTDVIATCDSLSWIDGNTYTSSNNTATYTLTNAAGCDSTITLDLTILNSSSTDSITACDSYTWIDGNTYTASNNTATHTLANAAGCDSVITLDLTINYSNTAADVISACNSYTWIDGNTYTTSNNTATHTLTNAAGCDSVVTLDLTIHYSNSATDVITACDSYTWIDGNTYTTSSNTATHTLTNATGCDSVVTLNLIINYSSTGTDVITACDSYTWIDGNTYTASNNIATHTLTNIAGCDSVITLDLTILNSASIDTVTTCDSYTWIDGNTYTISNNTATHTLTNAAGCDSVITLNLTINYTNTGTDVITACDSYTWIDGNTYTTSNNTATHTLTNTIGCDSVVTLNLTINYSNTGTDVITTCDSYTWIDGNTYTTSNNTATYILTNASGCDSIVTLDLTINYSNTATDIITACDSYTWIDGNTYTASNNTATHTLTNTVGCDSVITLDLTINYSNTGTDVITTCDNYTWIDGNTYTTSNNTATYTLTNSAGCDSVVTLDLAINYSNTGVDVITACDSYTWIDGNTYTTSNNTATHTVMNAAGCDSVVTLNLTINYSSTGTDVITACDSYTWIDGNTYTASNNTATHTLTNTVGCDSVITLDLTINYSNTGTDVITACHSYTWIDGNTYTASNNTATHTVANAVGCDSVITLDLTILNSASVEVITACDSYTWINGLTYTASNSTATDTLTNVAGCDSIVTLNLTISYSNTETDVITACNSYTWIDGNTYTSSNNTATHTLLNGVGCDSIVTLDLTINYSSLETDVITACDSYTWIDGNTYTTSNNTATYTLTNSVGCDSVITLDLTINTVSDVSTTIAGNTITANNTNSSYQWLDCDNGYAPISGETNISFTAITYGTYAVEVTENGCVDTSACELINLVGLRNYTKQNTFSIYPNPTGRTFNIEFEASQQSIDVYIYSITGKLVRNQHFEHQSIVELSLDQPTGIYFVTVQTPEISITSELILR